MVNKLIGAVLALLCYGLVVNGQDTDRVIVKKIADGIIQETTFGFSNKRTHEVVYDLNNLSHDTYEVNAYNQWRYWNGVLGLAMQRLGGFTGEHKYSDYSKKNAAFCFDNLQGLKKVTAAGTLTGMEQFFKFELLDDCGAMAADLADIYTTERRQDYRAYLDKTADYIVNKGYRLKDGTLSRTWPHDQTVWLDDLYMSVPFLARYAMLSHDPKYFDFAVRQVLLFSRHLYDQHTSLYFHCYYSGIDQNNPAYWSRANGWSIMAQAELLACLPKNHPARNTLLKIFRRQIAGFAKYQARSGLWHQLLNKEDSFLETSSSAMFVYAVALGINNGWLDEVYADLALSGWDGIKTMITAEGKVKNICKGTGTSISLKYYYDRPVPLNDIHGLGPVILAGVEVMKLKSKISAHH
jgi:unsaturated rhamnogalacturonyl hydrolase